MLVWCVYVLLFVLCMISWCMCLLDDVLIILCLLIMCMLVFSVVCICVELSGV